MAMRTRMMVVVANLMLATTACAHLPAGPVADAGQGAAGRGTLLIHATGDVSLDPDQITAFRTNGYGWAWSGLDGLFLNDDLTIVNLECPATDIVDPIYREMGEGFIEHEEAVAIRLSHGHQENEPRDHLLAAAERRVAER